MNKFSKERGEAVIIMATCLSEVRTCNKGYGDDERGNNEVTGGYDVQLCDEGAKLEHYCPICKLLMRDPVQTFRGRLACNYCYKKAKR